MSKNKKNSLIISKSVNPLKSNKKSFANISSNNNIFIKKSLLYNKSLYNNNKNKNNYDSNTHIRLVKNNNVQDTESSGNKRTKSDFNYYIGTNNINNSEKKEIKNRKRENKGKKINSKKYIINSILINANKSNVSPRKTKYLIRSRKKIKDFSEKNINNLNNNKSNSIRYNTGSRFNEKINYNLKNYDSSLDKKLQKSRKKNYNKKSKNLINNSEILNEKIKKKQKQDIESMIETQINNEIRQRMTIEKEKKIYMKLIKTKRSKITLY